MFNEINEPIVLSRYISESGNWLIGLEGNCEVSREPSESIDYLEEFNEY